MSNELQGKTIAFLVHNSGVEQPELTTPWQAVEAAGGTPVLIAPEKGQVQAFTDAGKPIAAICHGPWLLVEAGVLPGKTLTSFHTLQTDIRNAGAERWVDEQVFVCPANGWTLVTSRDPDDLDAFSAAVVEQFARA